MIGWVAAEGALTPEAWALFAIVFVWQIPHFMAIAWLYRDDFGRAGFPLLPVVEPDGRSTARQAVLFSVVLLPVSLAPYFLRMSGSAYALGAVVGALALLTLAVSFALQRTNERARLLFVGSITYLPLLVDHADRRPAAMIDYTLLPTVNATLNAISGIFLLTGTCSSGNAGSTRTATRCSARSHRRRCS